MLSGWTTLRNGPLVPVAVTKVTSPGSAARSGTGFDDKQPSVSHIRNARIEIPQISRAEFPRGAVSPTQVR
jgi:hypothetical protein